MGVNKNRGFEDTLNSLPCHEQRLIKAVEDVDVDVVICGRVDEGSGELPIDTDYLKERQRVRKRGEGWMRNKKMVLRVEYSGSYRLNGIAWSEGAVERNVPVVVDICSLSGG